MRDFFEEIAKHRASRRIWARILRDRFGASDPRSWTLRLFSGGDGTTLTSVEPLNNVVRTTMQTLAIVLSGAQAVHTMGWDEALALPDRGGRPARPANAADRRATRAASTRTVDPLGGSYYVETLTDELEARASRLLDEIERDGVLESIENGSLELAIADAAYRQQDGDRVRRARRRRRQPLRRATTADEQAVELLDVPERGALAAARAARRGSGRHETRGDVETALAGVRRRRVGAKHHAGDPRGGPRLTPPSARSPTRSRTVFGRHRASTVV